MKKICLCLCLIYVVVFTGCKCGNQNEAPVDVTPNNRLSEEDMDKMENEADMAAGFYLYDKDSKLIPNTEILNLENSELKCYLEFMNICKTEISFTVLIFINDELQEFTVDGKKKSYSYYCDKLGYREKNKINISLTASIKNIKQKNRITFFMIYNQRDYLDDSTFAASVQEDHVLNINGSTNSQIDSMSNRITYIHDNTSLQEKQYKLSISAQKKKVDYNLKKYIKLENDNLFFRILTGEGKYNALILVDGKVEKSFCGACVNEWNQKHGFASLMEARLGIKDTNKHKLLFLYYDVTDDKAEYTIYPLLVISKSS